MNMNIYIYIHKKKASAVVMLYFLCDNADAAAITVASGKTVSCIVI